MVARPFQRITIKRRHVGLVVHEPLGLAGSAEPELAASAGNISWCRATAQAMERSLKGSFAEARARYEALLAEFPGDKAARLMRDVAAREIDLSEDRVS